LKCIHCLVGDLADLGHITSDESYSWNLDWRRERFEWEKQFEVQLLDLVSKVHWTIEGHDRLLWEGNDQKVYTVKSRYNVLNREDLMHTSEVFRVLRSLKIMPPAIICACSLLLDRLPTRVNLARKGIQVGNSCCPLCSEGVESTQHLFSICRVARSVWDQCERWVVNMLVRHEGILIHFQSLCLIGQRRSAIECEKGCEWLLDDKEIFSLA